MDCFKLKQKLFILFILFILIFPFALITITFAYEEESIEFDFVTNLQISSGSNVFTYRDDAGWCVGYIPIEKNYIYTVSGMPVAMPVAESDSVPSVNETYNFLTSVEANGSYTYRSNGGYLYLCFRSSNTGDKPIVTRRPIESMSTTVSDLVTNVGIDSIWNIFDISINYIVVVVVVAFGFFIIFKLIKKLTKGKEGM